MAERERLEALFTSQQRLLADVSHELRTPLTVIKGNADLMRRIGLVDVHYRRLGIGTIALHVGVR